MPPQEHLADIDNQEGVVLALFRKESVENLNPSHDSEMRKSSLKVAVISLAATTCGGGVLSLPRAFCRTGIIPTTLLMIYGMCANDFVSYILISCARRTGGQSYGDVAKAAFGNSAEIVTTILMALLLIGCLTAYLVLVKDIWTPLVLCVLPSSVRGPLLEQYPTSQGTYEDAFPQASKEGSDFILFLILIAGMPFLVKRDLHALRYTSYVGFLSCTMLMVAVVYRAYQAVTSGREHPPIKWYSTNISDYAFTFPIVILCFQCCYNVLGVHSSLINPTRQRLRHVLDASMISCFVLFYLVGVGGYLYALDDTRDNILLNFSTNDPAILLGRLGFCFTLLFVLPLVTLPAREAFRDLPGQFRSWREENNVKGVKDTEQKDEETDRLVAKAADFEKLEPFAEAGDPVQMKAMLLSYGSTDIQYTAEKPDSGGSSSSSVENMHVLQEPRTSEMEEHNIFDFEQFVHVGVTLAVVGFCYIAATSVPGVGFVWSVCGSTMGVTITYIVPTACYLKIRWHKGLNIRSLCTWTLLVASCIAAPICTQQSIMQA